MTIIIAAISFHEDIVKYDSLFTIIIANTDFWTDQFNKATNEHKMVIKGKNFKSG